MGGTNGWKWMALGASVLSIACGAPNEGFEAPESAEPADFDGTRLENEPVETRAIPESAQLAAAKTPAAAFDVKLVGSELGHLNGAAIHGALAVMGCGYWVIDTSQSHVAQGAFSIGLDEGQGAGYGGMTLFVYADRDADGLCDTSKGDSLWQLQVEEGEGQRLVRLTSATPEADGWECMLFAEDGD